MSENLIPVANIALSNLNAEGEARLRVLPTGVILPSPLTSLAGFILCNGQAISRTTYSALFTAIGTSFGTGDGSTTFNVPDYRGKFLRGLGGNSASNMYTPQAEGLPNISGGFATNDNGTNYNNGAFYNDASLHWKYNGGNWGTYGGNVAFDASRSNSIYGASNHVTPENYAVNYFIKY